MRRGSSCTIEIDIPNLGAAEVKNIYVVANQKGFTIKKKAKFENGKAIVSYDAKETKEFASGRLFLQIVTETENGETFQSDIATYNISDTLDKGDKRDAISFNGFEIKYPY